MRTQPEPVTHKEITAAYRSADLKRHGIGLAKLLENPTLYRALLLTALARRKKMEAA